MSNLFQTYREASWLYLLNIAISFFTWYHHHDYDALFWTILLPIMLVYVYGLIVSLRLIHLPGIHGAWPLLLLLDSISAAFGHSLHTGARNPLWTLHHWFYIRKGPIKWISKFVCIFTLIIPIVFVPLMVLCNQSAWTPPILIRRSASYMLMAQFLYIITSVLYYTVTLHQSNEGDHSITAFFDIAWIAYIAGIYWIFDVVSYLCEAVVQLYADIVLIDFVFLLILIADWNVPNGQLLPVTLSILRILLPVIANGMFIRSWILFKTVKYVHSSVIIQTTNLISKSLSSAQESYRNSFELEVDITRAFQHNVLAHSLASQYRSMGDWNQPNQPKHIECMELHHEWMQLSLEDKYRQLWSRFSLWRNWVFPITIGRLLAKLVVVWCKWMGISILYPIFVVFNADSQSFLRLFLLELYVLLVLIWWRKRYRILKELWRVHDVFLVYMVEKMAVFYQESDKAMARTKYTYHHMHAAPLLLDVLPKGIAIIVFSYLTTTCDGLEDQDKVVQSESYIRDASFSVR